MSITVLAGLFPSHWSTKLNNSPTLLSKVRTIGALLILFPQYCDSSPDSSSLCSHNIVFCLNPLATVMIWTNDKSLKHRLYSCLPGWITKQNICIIILMDSLITGWNTSISSMLAEVNSHNMSFMVHHLSHAIIIINAIISTWDICSLNTLF